MQMWVMLCYVDKVQVQKIVQNPSHILLQYKWRLLSQFFLFFTWIEVPKYLPYKYERFWSPFNVFKVYNVFDICIPF